MAGFDDSSCETPVTAILPERGHYGESRLTSPRVADDPRVIPAMGPPWGVGVKD